MDGFWLGGCEAYLESLRKDFDERVDALNDQLKTATSSEEAIAIKSQIREAREAYEQRVSQASRSLF